MKVKLNSLYRDKGGVIYEVVKVDEQYNATWVYVLPQGAEDTIDNRKAYGSKVFDAKFKKYEEE
jgi:hypothetical protein